MKLLFLRKSLLRYRLNLKDGQTCVAIRRLERVSSQVIMLFPGSCSAGIAVRNLGVPNGEVVRIYRLSEYVLTIKPAAIVI
ncbi:hypothetical protein [Desulfosporosinus sp. FKB]|uniref:hypothetical protein n=1 Tax=Desulfosporosinus sp. FKB TaxID=1969835 RepID=UPI000B4A1A37|nr:hypothetical protein [Desulfosporosinus sp. FKB]